LPEHKVRSQGRVEEDGQYYASYCWHRYRKILDVAIHTSPIRLTVENKAAGYKRLSAELRLAGVGRVGIEASGGYERGVIKHLREEGFEVIQMQPMQVKAFAKLHLKRAKSDILDAALIAACAAHIQPNATIEDKRLQTLADALTFVEQAEEDIARFKTRLEKAADPRHVRMIRDDIKRQTARRRTELARIVAALRRHADLARRLELVQSIPGIGERTAVAIVVRMPEIGTLSREQAASLSGLAPFDDDSGNRRGLRHIAGGRERLRRSLYAAALAAAFHWNPALKALYQRLIAAGKPHKLALVACARKLIIYANTVVQRDALWKAIP
jgi:transposase